MNSTKMQCRYFTDFIQAHTEKSDPNRIFIDKIAAQKFLDSANLKTPTKYFTLKSFDEIDFEKLPDPVVLKLTNLSSKCRLLRNNASAIHLTGSENLQSPSALPFANYLSDMLIPFTFWDYGLVGKKELYMYLSGSKKLIKRFPGEKHKEVDFVAGPTFLLKTEIFNKFKFPSLNRGEDSLLIKNLKDNGIKIYATDPFNFIGWRGNLNNHTWDASDEYFLSAKQTKVVANSLNYEICAF